MNKQVFREYDVRGIIGSQIPMNETPDLTKAILTYFIRQKPNLTDIVVGMDGRTHSPEFKKYVIKAATDMGLNVTDIGTCPTPVFYFSLFNIDISSGMIVTASHNPKEYNGIKICLDKKSVWGTEIKKIKEIFFEKDFYVNKTGKTGSVKTYDALSHYIGWLKDHFRHLQDLDIDAIVDCGNGTAGTVFPKLIEEMGWKNVKLLYPEVDGNFPNHEADPTTMKNMLDVKHELETKSYKIGLGLDGDCDRMNPMTKSGYLVPGDQLLALYTKKIIKEFKNPSIVFDIKSSSGLIEALESYGARPCIAPSGHSIIKAHLLKEDAKLAGELSCHFFFNDRYFGYDDGIYAALRLFELLEEDNMSLDNMIETLPKRVSSPEYRIACKEEDKSKIVDHLKAVFAKRTDADLLTIDGIRASMSYGWGLIRASNTQAVICLRFESDTCDGLKKVKDDFTKPLLKFYSEQELLEKLGE